jgi:4-carboxymuconolactone decarboxylase
MARVPFVDRENMDTEGQVIYDRIRSDRNAPKVGFQFRALLNSPQATSHLTSMGTQLRFHSALPEDLKELAIIIAAREWNSHIEWTAHAAIAEKAGVSKAVIEAVRTHKAPAGLNEREQVVAKFVLQLLREKDVSDEHFAAAQKLLGTKGVVDLVLTCCYYTSLGMAQIALKIEMEDGKVSTL